LDPETPPTEYSVRVQLPPLDPQVPSSLCHDICFLLLLLLTENAIMKASITLLGLAAALAAASDVHDLGKDSFEPFIKEHDLVLAECMY